MARRSKDPRQAKLRERLRELRSRSVEVELDRSGQSLFDPSQPFFDHSLKAPMWIDEQGVHAIFPGEEPDEESLERMTLEYQRQIRQSPLFAEMVKWYGRFKAEQLVKECKAKLR